MSEHTPFLTIFPGCEDIKSCAGGLEKAYVTDVQVDLAELMLTVCAWFPAMPSPVDISSISQRLKEDYGLSGVGLVPDYPKVKLASTAAAAATAPAPGGPPKGDVLMGRAIKQRPVPMNTLSLESGKVTVEGDVVAVTSRRLQKRGSAVLCFDITDRTNSIRISRFLRSEDDQSIIDSINVGDHIIAQGEIIYSKYDEDMVLDPRNIMKGKAYIRPDKAPVKRVELHMHTRFSALDALTDPAAIVKRAAYWGMPAIAVTDHGVEYDHPDLAGNMWVNEAELNGTPGVDDDNNGYVDDIYGWNVILDSGTINPGTHGTHVAGTVAAVNNNGIGVCGVAGGTGNGDGARIMSLAIFDSTSANAGSYPDAYAYAADNGAVISQNSWGYTSGVAMPQDVSDALDYFIANAGVDENGNQTGLMKGGLLVFAAGNEGTPSARMPAADPRTLCVTAMCSDYTRPNYANYSDDVDIFAPGGADGNDRNYSDADRVYSTDLDGGYSYKWGTSMACPHVSGIDALVIAHYGVGHPGFTVEECREILLRSYRSVSEYVEPKYDGKLGVGLADAGMIFLEDAGTAPGTVSAPAARAMGRELELAWTVPADGNGLPVAEFRLTYTGRGIGKTEGKAPDTSGEVVLRNYTAVAETATYIWTGQYNTEYRFEVSGIDRFGHESEKVSFSHSTGDYENGKPRTQQDFAPVEFENVGEAYALSFDLSEYFTDPNFGDGDMLSYSLINRNEDIVDAAVQEGRLVLLPVGKGTGRVTVTATDLDGEGVQSVLTVTVLNGPEPAAPAEGLRLSPNPAGDELGIAAGVRDAEVEVTVYDAAARRVIVGTVALDSRGYGTLNVSALAPGTYTLVLEAPGLSENGSFVKR